MTISGQDAGGWLKVVGVCWAVLRRPALWRGSTLARRVHRRTLSGTDEEKSSGVHLQADDRLKLRVAKRSRRRRGRLRDLLELTRAPSLIRTGSLARY